MAYQENLEFIDMEFMQFEPCGFVYPPSLIGNVIPTTLLMAGGVLKNANNERFMLKYNKDIGEKVQKDELSRAMHREIIEGRGTKHGGLYYDVTMLPRELIVRNHSIFYEPAIKAGIDITKEPAEVAPIAHTSLGGIIVNEECETSLKGLYAAGEVTGGLHGANRLGGNSGAETLVFGARAGFYSAKYAIAENYIINKNKINDRAKEKISEIELFRNKNNENLDPSIIRKEIHSVMSLAGSILRNKNQLTDALQSLGQIQNKLSKQYAENTNQLLEIIKNNNMVIVAKIIINAALIRTESRGAHFREDFPSIDNENWLKNIIIRKGESKLESEIRINKIRKEE